MMVAGLAVRRGHRGIYDFTNKMTRASVETTAIALQCLAVMPSQETLLARQCHGAIDDQVGAGDEGRGIGT